MLLLRLHLVARGGRGVLALMLAADVVCLLVHAHCQADDAEMEDATRQPEDDDEGGSGRLLHRALDAAVGLNCLATIVAAVMALKAHESAPL